MKGSIRLGWVIASLVMLWLSPAEASLLNETFGDVSIRQLPFLTTPRSHRGVTAFRFRVTNNSLTTLRIVRLTLRGRSTRYDHLRSVSREVVLSPSARALVVLRIHDLTWLGSRMEVTLDRQTTSETYKLRNFSRFGSRSHEKYVRILTSASFPSHTLRFLNKYYMKRLKKGKVRYFSVYKAQQTIHLPRVPWYEYRRLRFEFLRTQQAIPAWHRQWLDYTPYAGVLLTGKEWDRAPAPVRRALVRFTEAGGSLFVVGSWNAPLGWKRERSPSKASSSSAQSVVTRPAIVDEYRPGFGRAFVFKESSADQLRMLPKVHLWKIYSASFRSLLPFQTKMRAEVVNKAFPVVRSQQLPIGSIFTLLLVFCVLLGPVSVLYLTYRGKRLWILATVPGFALLASVVLFAYGTLLEGWNGTIRTTSVTFLDQTQRKAVTLGWKAYYFPLSLRNGLQFKPGTEVSSQVVFGSRGLARSVSVDWTRGQHLKSGWVEARVPLHLRIRKVEQRRERLTIRWEKSGRPSVTNGLGADIKELWLQGKTRDQVYYLKSLPAGVRATMKPLAVFSKREVPRRRLFVSSGLRFGENPKKLAKNYLTSNAYVAVLRGSPFVETTTRSKSKRRMDSIVLGRFGGGARAR